MLCVLLLCYEIYLLTNLDSKATPVRLFCDVKLLLAKHNGNAIRAFIEECLWPQPCSAQTLEHIPMLAGKKEVVLL